MHQFIKCSIYNDASHHHPFIAHERNTHKRAATSSVNHVKKTAGQQAGETHTYGVRAVDMRTTEVRHITYSSVHNMHDTRMYRMCDA